MNTGGNENRNDTFVMPAGCLNYIEGSEWMSGIGLHRR